MNRLICWIKSAWYAYYEPRELRYAREEWVESQNPLVSICIPTHNRAEILIDRALRSAVNQTYSNLEILVAAHGCTDRTVEMAEGLADPRVYVFEVIREKTYPPTIENHWFAGPVAPMNVLLDIARGDWIARLDDDDYWTPTHIETLLKCAESGDFEFVSSAYERVRDGKREIVPHDGGDPPIGGVQTWLYRSYLRFMRYNSDCWRKKHNRPNDLDLADRFRKAGVRIGWTPQVTAYVLPRPNENTIGLSAYRRDAANKKRDYAFK